MPLGPKEMPWGMWKIEMIQSWAEIFLGFLQLDEYQVYQVNFEVLSFKREFGWIALWFHDLYIGAAEHDRYDSGVNSGVSTSPSLEHVDSMRSLRQSISPEIPKYGYWSFFRSLISPSEARSFFETKVERIRISQSWTLSRRASDGFGWICCIFNYSLMTWAIWRTTLS